MAFERRQYSGNAQAATLAGPIDNVTASIACGDLTNWPDGSIGPFGVTLDRGKPTEERVKAFGRSGNTLTGCLRGQDGTAASPHQVVVGAVEHTISKTDLDEANQHYSDTTLNHHPQYARLAAGTNTFTGQLLAKALSHYFGPGADGTTNQSRLHVQAFDAIDVGVIAENSDQPDCNLLLRGKGAGTVNIQAPAGNTMVRAEVGGATPAASTALSVECNGNAIATQRIVLGAADSAGAGFRTLRVPN